jgi:hypothetical protein
MSEEMGWLVEHADSAASVPMYFAGVDWARNPACMEWSADHQRAVRFARRVDAEHAMRGYLDFVRICEHRWD